jgi:hypothetical protein
MLANQIHDPDRNAKGLLKVGARKLMSLGAFSRDRVIDTDLFLNAARSGKRPRIAATIEIQTSTHHNAARVRTNLGNYV